MSYSLNINLGYNILLKAYSDFSLEKAITECVCMCLRTVYNCTPTQTFLYLINIIMSKVI